ncbi:uncharacterized protein LOC109787965 [Cajanus cajan]|uniref:Transmembrane protein n=1 Tax=Cajanus cajan TaxID=3821 RepID=A0A151RDJ1_CAJCA|nr:uncharacterized protein LOC109787965 [Cajanus cajan]KYP40539.1 hypothetical protein KK1_038138 [Cajanus cajan]
METFSLSRNPSSLIILSRPSLPSTRHSQISLPHRHSFNPITCTSSDNNSSNTSTNDVDANSVQAPSSSAVEISFRRRSRRQAKRQRESENSTKARVTETPPKKWEDMNLSEKAMELYVGEKGALFWLNKFAYASIFIMIGGWILFRFVGPAFNLYQLDGPPLAPSDVFK